MEPPNGAFFVCSCLFTAQRGSCIARPRCVICVSVSHASLVVFPLLRGGTAKEVGCDTTPGAAGACGLEAMIAAHLCKRKFLLLMSIVVM